MTIDKVLLQTPAGQRLIAEKERQLEEKYARKAEETVRKAEEAAARKVEEAARKAEEAARKAEEATRKAEEAAARKAEEAAARKAEESGREAVRKGILRVLQKRFGPVPDEVARSVAAIQALPQLDDLLDLAVMCPDLAAFRQALSLPGGT